MISGLYTALITPFNNEGSLNEEALRRLMRQQIAAGVTGVVLLGTTAETPTLEEEEKERIVAIGIEECKGKIKVMVGTGNNATKKAAAATRRAQELGADSALVVAPYYNRPEQRGLLAHFLAVADSSTLPILIYNHPKRCGTGLTCATLAKLAAHPNIAGVKDSSGSFAFIEELIATIKPRHPDFSILTGNDNEGFLTLALGGDGIVSVAGNLIPKELLSLFGPEGRKEHYRLLPLFNALSWETNPIPIKAALNAVGFPAGPLRLPMSSMEESKAAALAEVIEATLGAARW